MPKLPPKQKLRYRQAMRSLWTLFRTQPLLRESCMMGALVFASFSCFWTTLTFLLDSHYGLGAGVAGTFGLVGAAGALVASFAGRMADRRGSRWVVGWGGGFLAFSYALLWLGESLRMSTVLHLAILVVGVVVLDMGAQMTQVANQTRIFGLVPAGAESNQYGLYDDVLRWGGGGVCAGDGGVGALGLEWGVRACAWADWVGGAGAADRHPGQGQSPAQDDSGR